MPTHRGIDYRIIQGVEPRSWKWELALSDRPRSGHSMSRLDAVRAAERAIDKLLAPAKKRLVPGGNPG